jgi:CHAT domain-containing protein
MALYLQIHRVGNTLTAGVYEGTDILSSTIRQRDTCAVTDEKIRELCMQMEAGLQRAVSAGSADSDLKQLREVGLQMWMAFIPRSVGETLTNGSSQPLILDITGNLVGIPWELLHNGEWFLCQHYAMGRIVATEQTPRQIEREVQKLPIRMLIVADPAADSSESYEEGNSVRETLKDRKKKFNIEFQAEIDVTSLQSLLLACDVAYYTGHAQHFPDQIDRSGLLLMNGEVFNTEAIEAWRGLAIPPPLLIFANACESGQTAGWMDPKQTYGIANAFLLEGVRFYIGTFCKIPDTEKATFLGISLFEGLVENQPIGVALRNARQKAMKRFGDEAIFWASYMLYGNPTYRLFDQPSPEDNLNTEQEGALKKLPIELSSGTAATNEGHFDEAEQHYNQAKEYARQLDNERWLNYIDGLLQQLESTKTQHKDAWGIIQAGTRPGTLAQLDRYKNLEKIEFDFYRTL